MIEACFKAPASRHQHAFRNQALTSMGPDYSRIQRMEISHEKQRFIVVRTDGGSGACTEQQRDRSGSSTDHAQGNNQRLQPVRERWLRDAWHVVAHGGESFRYLRFFGGTEHGA